MIPYIISARRENFQFSPGSELRIQVRRESCDLAARQRGFGGPERRRSERSCVTGGRTVGSHPRWRPAGTRDAPGAATLPANSPAAVHKQAPTTTTTGDVFMLMQINICSGLTIPDRKAPGGRRAPQRMKSIQLFFVVQQPPLKEEGPLELLRLGRLSSAWWWFNPRSVLSALSLNNRWLRLKLPAAMAIHGPFTSATLRNIMRVCIFDAAVLQIQPRSDKSGFNLYFSFGPKEEHLLQSSSPWCLTELGCAGRLTWSQRKYPPET